MQNRWSIMKYYEVLFKQIPGTGHPSLSFVPAPSVKIVLELAEYDYRECKSCNSVTCNITARNRPSMKACIWVHLSSNKIWHNSLMCTPCQNQASLKIDSRCIMFSNNPSTTNNIADENVLSIVFILFIFIYCQCEFIFLVDVERC